MEKFTVHQGIAAPLIRDNIDTDTIIPSREMKKVSKLGLGEGLFSAWRYLNEKARTPNPEFVLNQPKYKHASVLLAGDNFGCGSSREHAVWALKDFGVRAILAIGFGSIFQRNCVRNGILPIPLSRDQIIRISQQLDAGSAPDITIDLQQKTIGMNGLETIEFEIDDGTRHLLLEGLDTITLTQTLQDKIDGFQQRDRVARPWIYSSR